MRDGFLLFAARHYDGPSRVSVEDFDEDMKRFRYIKRLFSRYTIDPSELKERLILNHIIVLYNVFGSAATWMLFHKLDGYHHLLKPFLILLSRMPERIDNVGRDGRTVISSDVGMDAGIVKALRGIEQWESERYSQQLSHF